MLLLKITILSTKVGMKIENNQLNRHRSQELRFSYGITWNNFHKNWQKFNTQVYAI